MSGNPAKVTVKGLEESLSGISDYRIIQIRRTIVYIEQSIAGMLQPFVFEPSTEKTWNSAAAITSQFLNGLWLQGGLNGSSASDAHSVACGLGSTMTAQDVANGTMILVAAVAVVKPAEFIELVFERQMQAAS